MADMAIMVDTTEAEKKSRHMFFTRGRRSVVAQRTKAETAFVTV